MLMDSTRYSARFWTRPGSTSAVGHPISRFLGSLQELRRRQRAAREAGHPDSPLKVEQPVDSHTHRCLARPLRRQMDLRRAVLYPVDVASELLAIVDGGHVKPGAERVQT